MVSLFSLATMAEIDIDMEVRGRSSFSPWSRASERGGRVIVMVMAWLVACLLVQLLVLVACRRRTQRSPRQHGQKNFSKDFVLFLFIERLTPKKRIFIC